MPQQFPDSIQVHEVDLNDAAAMDTHLMLLREMASLLPDKCEKIETLTARYDRP